MVLDFQSGNPKRFYKEVGRNKKRLRLRSVTMLKHNADIVKDSRVAIRDSWKCYFDEQLNRPTQEEHEIIVLPAADVNIPFLAMEETTTTIKKLKNNRAAGNKSETWKERPSRTIT